MIRAKTKTITTLLCSKMAKKWKKYHFGAKISNILKNQPNRSNTSTAQKSKNSKNIWMNYMKQCVRI